MTTRPKNTARNLASRILVCILLRLNGWRPCTLSNGDQGWELVVPKTTLRGDWRYAMSRLLG